MKLVLASQSPFRKKLLEDHGFQFEVHKPWVDETAMKMEWEKANPNGSARDLCLFLAKQKCEVVWQSHQDSVVIGSDQVIELNNQIFGKGHTPDQTLQHLMMMNGKSHKVWTAFYVKAESQSIPHIDETIMHMKSWNPDQLRNYIQLDETWNCAGGYKIEKHGLLLFDRIDTHDYTAVIGLPMMALAKVLSHLKVAMPF